MKTLFLLLILSLSSHAADLSSEYQLNYGQSLSQEERNKLVDTEIVFIPGIASETFVWSDPRSVLDLSIIFKNAFSSQLKHYNQLEISTRRLWASSYSVQETIDEIAETMTKLRIKKKKALFITHSLGGLALLDYLIEQDNFKDIKGVLFLQSPFYGSPIASIYFQNPYFARTVMGPVLPWMNASEDSIQYLTLESRLKRMADKEEKIRHVISSIPILTMSGTTLNYKSLMAASANIMGYGCPTFISGKCRSRKIFEGPYSNSDGMVPLESSKLPMADYVIVDGVDHGETLQAMPYKTVNRVKFTDALMKILLRKII